MNNNMTIDKEIIKSIIEFLGVITAAIIGIFKYNKKDDKKIEKKSETLLVSFEQINDLNDVIFEMFSNTTADRFLLLMSDINNNKHNWVTAIYEQHKTDDNEKISLSFGATNRYVKLKIDQEYKSMIEEAKLRGVKRYTTTTMPNSILKDVYVYERVTHSNIYYLYEFNTEDGPMSLFCSFAKHDDNPFSPSDEIIFKVGVDKITNKILK